VGDFPLIKFCGPFSFNLAARKVEFDFTSIAVLGLPKFDLPTGGAAEIGAATGLGSDKNKKLLDSGKKVSSIGQDILPLLVWKLRFNFTFCFAKISHVFLFSYAVFPFHLAAIL